MDPRTKAAVENAGAYGLDPAQVEQWLNLLLKVAPLVYQILATLLAQPPAPAPKLASRTGCDPAHKQCCLDALESAIETAKACAACCCCCED